MVLKGDEKVGLMEFSFLESGFPCLIIIFLDGKGSLHVPFFGLIDDFDEVDSGMIEFDFDVGVFLGLFVTHE